jgi:salicylate hydroxylase
MALEDAVTLGAAVQASDFDLPAAFKLYEAARVARTARVVLSVREMGRIYHAKGVERRVRNGLWVGRSPERFYDAVEWLYAWRPEHCLGEASEALRPGTRPVAGCGAAATSASARAHCALPSASLGS